MPVPQSRPWLRFLPPLIEPDLRISRIRLSDGLHERACAGLGGAEEVPRDGSAMVVKRRMDYPLLDAALDEVPGWPG